MVNKHATDKLLNQLMNWDLISVNQLINSLLIDKVVAINRRSCHREVGRRVEVQTNLDNSISVDERSWSRKKRLFWTDKLQELQSINFVSPETSWREELKLWTEAWKEFATSLLVGDDEPGARSKNDGVRLKFEGELKKKMQSISFVRSHLWFREAERMLIFLLHRMRNWMQP